MKIPPTPYSYMVTARPGEHEGAGHVYLVDASGRKIASLWGNPGEKIALALFVIDAAAKLNETRRIHVLAAASEEA